MSVLYWFILLTSIFTFVSSASRNFTRLSSLRKAKMPLAKFFTFHRGEYDARVRKGNEVTVSDALKELYGTKILPLEKHYNYEVR